MVWFARSKVNEASAFRRYEGVDPSKGEAKRRRGVRDGEAERQREREKEGVRTIKNG